VAYLTQTTLSVAEANLVIEALKAKFPHIAAPPKEDICYATTNRQDAVAQLAQEADMVIVLGSQNSSNSRRLQEIALSFGKPAYLIDGVHELDPAWLEGVETVLITAGASAPEVVVQECVDYLVENHNATVREAVIREEHVTFPLPRELRQLQSGV
jgi:4-hydroxy-3-methylbut-2-enyl diphosphate reductase